MVKPVVVIEVASLESSVPVSWFTNTCTVVPEGYAWANKTPQEVSPVPKIIAPTLWLLLATTEPPVQEVRVGASPETIKSP